MQSENSGRLLKLGVTRVPDHIRVRPHQILARIEEVQGYNSVQLLRYWTFIRTINSRPPVYNRGLFIENPPRVVYDLLQIGGVLAPKDLPPAPGWERVSSRGKWITYSVPDEVPRASLVTAFRVVDDSDAARMAVTSPGFDPSSEAILEEEPGIDPEAVSTAGAAEYEWTGPGSARITVTAPTDSLLIVRNMFAEHWRARVDDRPTTVLAANYVVQAIPVPAGRHTVLVEYVDPWIGYGLVGSGLSLLGLLGAALVVRRRERVD
jgi:hypothetical protein